MVELGVSQAVLESEYYMIDLPFILEEKRKQDAQNTLMTITVNSLPHMSGEEGTQKAEEIIQSLRLYAGYVDDLLGEPDTEGLAKLKAMLSRN